MLIFFADPMNVAVWTSFTRLTAEITNFVNMNNTLANYIQQHYTDITGITTAKNDAFASMVATVVNKAQKAYVWAIDNSNNNLAAIFDVKKSNFMKGSEITAFSKIKNIRDSIAANIAMMKSVQLDAADVAMLNSAITTYQNAIGSQGAAQAHKTQGTKALEKLLYSIDKSLNLIDKFIFVRSCQFDKRIFIESAT